MKRIYFEKNDSDDRGLIPMNLVKHFSDAAATEMDITWKVLYDAEIFDIMVKSVDGPFISNHNIGNLAINRYNNNEFFFIFEIKEQYKNLSSVYNRILQLIYSLAVPTVVESIFTIIPAGWIELYSVAFKNNNYSVAVDDKLDIAIAKSQIDLKDSEI